MKIQELFFLGMDREIPKLLSPPQGGRLIDVGASGTKKTLPEALGYPEWVWPRDRLPAERGEVAAFHAFHFFENLSGDDAISLLRSMESRLMPKGIINIVVPYYNSSMQAQDLTHKSAWNEGTIPTLMNNSYYDPAGQWLLKLHTQFIMGIAERNLALFIQLTKD